MDISVPLQIQGCPIHFPHKPYPSQLSMMSRIIQALNKKENCLLESPTGSGKTLALLCATLGWLKKEIETQEKAIEEHRKKQEMFFTNSGDCCPACRSSNVLDEKPMSTDDSAVVIDDSDDEEKEPDAKRTKIGDPDDDDFQEKSLLKINFWDADASCSKNEEKNASCEDCSCHFSALEELESVKMPKIIYATRTHGQIEQVVREMKRTHYSNMKSTVLSSRDHTCVNQKVFMKREKHDACKELLKESACSFYERVKNVNHHTKLKSKCDLEGAWDIEDLVKALAPENACPYYVARELMSSANIIFAPYSYIIEPGVRDSVGVSLNDSIIIFDEAHNIENFCSEAASIDIKMDQLERAKKDLVSLITIDLKPESHGVLLNLIENMIKVIDLAKPRLMRQDFDAAHLTWSGQEIVALMDKVGIGPNRLSEVKKHYANVMDENDKESLKNRMSKKKVKMDSASSSLFELIFLILGFIFNDNMRFCDDYQAALVQTTEYSREEDATESTNSMWLGKQRRSQPISRVQERQVLTLSFWCMNPQVAFKIIGESARSVILTSGTLSPLDSFASELGSHFPVRLEANHVVKNEQTLIGTIGCAPSGGSLCATYQNYTTFRFQDDLGHLINSFCRMVPHGVLCFMPSYHIMQKMIERWENTGLLEQLRKVKEIITEPRKATEMAAALSDFYTCIEETENRGRDRVSGALLLAVCRGKMSEGQDFADNKARLVVTVGIPYPSIKEPKINLKRSYNDQRRTSGLLTGSQWYEVQAFRALNQSLGRCIRHRDDWGAVIMVDARLSGDRYMPRISKWLRQRVHHYGSYRELAIQMEEFVERRASDMKKKKNIECEYE